MVPLWLWSEHKIVFRGNKNVLEIVEILNMSLDVKFSCKGEILALRKKAGR